MTTVTAMFYYTPEFKFITPNLEEYFKKELNKLNKGYKNSGIPLKCSIKGTEKLNILESINDEYRIRLKRFRFKKGNVIMNYRISD